MNQREEAAGLIKRVFWGKPQSTAIQFIRYTAVGGVAFAVDFGSLFLLTDGFGIHYLTSAAVAFVLGLTVNYLLSVSWVFDLRALADRRKEFAIFAAIGLLGLGFNELFIWFFTEHIHFHYLISKACSTVLVFLWNFVARKYILFR
jgi:putative flippase GtrA